MIIQKIQNLFKRNIQRRTVIGASFILANAITTQANFSGGKLRIQ